MDLRITTLLSHTLVATHWVPYTGYHTLGQTHWVQNTGYHTDIHHLPLWNCVSCLQRNNLPWMSGYFWREKKGACISITSIFPSSFPRAVVGECWCRGRGGSDDQDKCLVLLGYLYELDLGIPGLVFCFLVFMADVGQIWQYLVQPSTVQYVALNPCNTL